ncbi:CDF zinc transporter [Coprinopsis marcescibilis]|uniref:CDF zinc transporter n=1 Tax=Coprinopsis marcescibilis TaxID=230819 RepID=A0A5C3L9J3_COPMA|nr:CDF zinc transporter [Coprinopsis marcescibilis]
MKNTTRIGVVLAVSVVFFIVEIIVGFRTKSLALIADAFHYLNDIVSYVIAFVAAWLQESRKHTHEYTFAFHRAELVGAFFNGVFLLALALSIFLQSIERFVHVEEVSDPKLILIVGCVGLALNLISVLVVHDHHGHGHAMSPPNVNDGQTVELSSSHPLHATHNHAIDPPSAGSQHNLGLIGVLIHVMGDAVNNIGVIIVAIIIWKVEAHGRFYADPAASLLIALIIFGSAVPLTLRSGRILLEATPKHLDLEKVKQDITTLPLVQSVHDIHVWHLSQSVILASLHVCIPVGTTFLQWEKTEQYLQHCFAEYGIGHVTISPEIQRESSESSEGSGCDEAFGGCRAPSRDEFGCSVADLKKRRPGSG